VQQLAYYPKLGATSLAGFSAKLVVDGVDEPIPFKNYNSTIEQALSSTDQLLDRCDGSMAIALAPCLKPFASVSRSNAVS